MTRNEQADIRGRRKAGTPGEFSRWVQRKANARTNRKIRGGRSKFMGVDMLILNTVGRRSGLQRERPWRGSATARTPG